MCIRCSSPSGLLRGCPKWSPCSGWSHRRLQRVVERVAEPMLGDFDVLDFAGGAGRGSLLLVLLLFRLPLPRFARLCRTGPRGERGGGETIQQRQKATGGGVEAADSRNRAFFSQIWYASGSCVSSESKKLDCELTVCQSRNLPICHALCLPL